MPGKGGCALQDQHGQGKALFDVALCNMVIWPYLDHWAKISSNQLHVRFAGVPQGVEDLVADQA